MLGAGLLATAAALATAGVASAGTTAAAAQHRASNCTNEGPFFFNVTKNTTSYFMGLPNTVSAGKAAFLKPSKNGSTLWTLCVSNTTNQVVFTSHNLALTTRSTSPGETVTMTTVGNNGNGFSSQQWNYFENGSIIEFQNVKTNLWLRVRNNGPIMGQTVTTGFTPTDWTISTS
jgi:hypothetical protein